MAHSKAHTSAKAPIVPFKFNQAAHNAAISPLNMGDFLYQDPVVISGSWEYPQKEFLALS